MASKIRNISTSNSPSDDGELAIEKIYKQYFDRLYSYARVICDSEELAKDVVSDFFYNLLNKKTDLSNVGNLEVYLSVSIKNLCFQRLSKAAKDQKTEVLLATIDYVDPQQVLLGKELKRLLDKAINDLPDQCQLIFRMSKERGFSNKEIAKELQITTGTIKTQLVRAQAKIREAISLQYKDRTPGDPIWRLIGQILLMFGGI